MDCIFNGPGPKAAELHGFGKTPGSDALLRAHCVNKRLHKPVRRYVRVNTGARNLGKSHISFYGPGLGKTKLVETLRNAWFKNVYAPEDCDSIRSGCMAVCNREGAIALCMKKESFCTPLPNDSFSRNEITSSLEAFLRHKQ